MAKATTTPGRRAKKPAAPRKERAARGFALDFERQRREHLVNAVIACVSEEGFTKTTMRNIAERAGVSPGLLNYYFKSKDELVLEAIMYAREGTKAAIADEHVNFGPELLEKIVRRYVTNDFPQSVPESFRIWINSAALADAELQKHVSEWNQETLTKTTNSLIPGIEDGTLRSDLDVKTTAILISAAMHGAATIAAVAPKVVSVADTVRAMALLMRLLKPADAAAPEASAPARKPKAGRVRKS